jgi:hypothetical protein
MLELTSERDYPERTMAGEHEKLHTTHPDRAANLERAWQALELRKQRKSYRAIAAELGCSLSTAHGYVKEALDELRKGNTENAQELCDIEVQKLDAIEEALSRRFETADNQAAAKLAGMIIKTMESRRKLLGLDAPQKIATTGNLYTVRDASPDCPEWGQPHARQSEAATTWTPPTFGVIGS